MHTMYADVGHLSVLRRTLRSSVAPVLKKKGQHYGSLFSS